MEYRLNTPFDKAQIAGLRVGDIIYITGKLLTGRDAAHKRIFEAIGEGKPLPVEIKGQSIYYVGPCEKDGKVLSAGPTTSMRMDAYAPLLYDEGVVATIGKGDRNEDVYDAIKRNGGVYLAAIGGAGALYASKIKSSKVLAYRDLGTESIHEFEVEDFPCVVAIDSRGESVYRALRESTKTYKT